MCSCQEGAMSFSPVVEVAVPAEVKTQVGCFPQELEVIPCTKPASVSDQVTRNDDMDP